MQANASTITPGHAEPVLPAYDIVETTAFWKNTLCFTNVWTWGEPPLHGGASWGGCFIQFSLHKEAHPIQPQTVWVRTKNIEELHALHKKHAAEIASPLEQKPSGFVEYSVRDSNGHTIVFAEYRPQSVYQHALASAKAIIRNRKVSEQEYVRLATAVGWSSVIQHVSIAAILEAAISCFVAEDPDSGEAIGCALLLGDGVHFYYVKDVMIDPKWQHQKVGSAIMHSLMEWIETRRPSNAMVSLITGEQLTPFYRQFGFTPAFAMIRWITNP